MKSFAVTLLALSTLCGCSSRTQQATKSGPSAMQQTNEVASLLDSLKGRPLWYSKEGSSGVASNRLWSLKHIAVPMLLHRLSELDYEDDREIERLGLACAVLGTNAHPVLREVVKGVTSKDFSTQSGSMSILASAGPSSIVPVIEFSKSKTEEELYLLKRYFLIFLEDAPLESLAELVRLYRNGERTPMLVEFIRLEFREYLYCEDTQLITPVLRSVLSGPDDLLVLETLGYLKRCGQRPAGLQEGVTRLLGSANPEIRAAATNVVNLPLPQAN